MKTVYRGVRIRGDLDDVRRILDTGMDYYWKNAEESVNEIFRALERFHKISKLGNTPLLRSHLLEACRTSRLQVWGTQDKNNANSYARFTPELIFLVLRDVGIQKEVIKKYLSERFGEPYVVTFSVDLIDDGFCQLNTTYGRFIPPEMIQCIERVDVTQPDPHLAIFKDEKIIPEYKIRIDRNEQRKIQVS